MWDILQITHEGTIEVRMARLGTLTHEYEVFKMKPEESINEMQTRLTHIVSHMRTLVKQISNEELVINILIFLNHNWQPKVNVICESKNLETMYTHTHSLVNYWNMR